MSLSKQSIVDSALNLPSQKRNAYIEDACGGDRKLKQDVLVLLTQSDNETPENVPESANSIIGETVGQYQIESIIGAGGMGMIHKAKDTKLGRYVALKCLPPHLTINNQNRERFLNEARAVSRLDHPNICTLYEIGETDDKELYIALPFYEGYTLDKRIANGPIPYEDVIAITLQISEGLHHAHHNEIVHRDIKPANIIITKENILKILDFGVAKIAGVNLTSTGVSLGTVAYMSPEQLEGINVDARTDIWALGVLLYEMLMGERPFKGDQAPAIIHAVLYADLPDLKLPEHIPEALTQVLKKSITRNIDARYPSLQEFMDDLRKISNNETITPHAYVEKNSDKKVSALDLTTVNFDQNTIKNLIQQLTEHVGPMASILVNKAVKNSQNYVELCQHLDKHLPDEQTRQRMRQQFDILSSTDTMPQTVSTKLANFTEEQLDCMINVTTSFVGPMAKLLVQKYSKQTDSSDALSQKLAEHIDSESEKASFIKTAKDCF